MRLSVPDFDNDRLLPAGAAAPADPAKAASMTPALALASNFGSTAQWRSDVLAQAQALGGGPGWVALVFQPQDGRLVLRGSTPAQAAQPAERPKTLPETLPESLPETLPKTLPKTLPMLALATPVPGAPASAWADLLDRIDWALVYGRYQSAVHDAGADLGLAAQDIAGRTVLDVRRAGVFEAAPSTLPDARWCDPARVGDWSQQLPSGQAVLVYCVYGHEVGRVTALRLCAAGLDARFLIGGIDGWQTAGRPLAAKAGPTGAAS